MFSFGGYVERIAAPMVGANAPYLDLINSQSSLP